MVQGPVQALRDRPQDEGINRRYCDPGFGPIEDRAWLFKVRAVRSVVVPMKRAGSALRRWRDRWQDLRSILPPALPE